MAASLASLRIRDGSADILPQRVLDVSGLGAGPFLPLHCLAGPTGSGPIDIEALFASLGSNTRQSLDLATRIAREGETLTLYAEGSVTLTPSQSASSPLTVTTTVNNTTASNAAPLGGAGAGRMLWIEAVRIGFAGLPAGTTVTWQLGGYGDPDGKFPQFILRGTYSAGGGDSIIPVRQLFRPNRQLKSDLVFSIRNVGAAVASNTTVYGVVNITGIELTDDPNFNADKTFLVVGDSLSYGKGYGPSVSSALWTHKIRDRYRALGHDIRLVSFAQPGRTSGQFEAADRQYGKLHGIKANLGMYALGTNDALLAAANFPDTWEANFRAFWAEWAAQQPQAPLIVPSCGPLALTADNANAATLKTRQAAVVASIASPRCVFVDITTAFDRTVASFFRAGDNVHWSDTGHAAVYAAIDAALGTAVVPS